ncbi:hypothetical protein [Arthrobacter psychrochitiniphilus]|nr:hypothetical protein [Arthrobacter psychrochitiniphilus]NYG15956.1 hypothetical protein [Arthrobacter psychrochitiniphilus]
MPTDEPAPKPIILSELERRLAAFPAMDDPMKPRRLARLRISMLEELARLPMTDNPLADAKIEAIVQCALLAYQSVGSIARQDPKPILLWNEELEPAQFLTRTLFLADHVLIRDQLFEEISRAPTNRSVGELARRELEDKDLLGSGRVIAVPQGVAMALGQNIASVLAGKDLKNSRLMKFAHSQLVVEGPTARSVLIVNAKDDFEHSQKLWLYGRIDAENLDESGTFKTKMLQPYDSNHDYQPWVQQVMRDAATFYVQRSAERLTVADIMGAEYVAASPFEARLLQMRSSKVGTGTAAASLWADVPSLANLQSRDLARILNNDGAVEDLRGKVRAAVATAPLLGDQTLAITQLVADIEHASSVLESNIRTSRAYSAILPALAGGAGLVVGATGGVLGLTGAALATAGGLLPYIDAERSARRDASYLFITARRQRSNKAVRGRRV